MPQDTSDIGALNKFFKARHKTFMIAKAKLDTVHKLNPNTLEGTIAHLSSTMFQELADTWELIEAILQGTILLRVQLDGVLTALEKTSSNADLKHDIDEMKSKFSAYESTMTSLQKVVDGIAESNKKREKDIEGIYV